MTAPEITRDQTVHDVGDDHRVHLVIAQRHGHVWLVVEIAAGANPVPHGTYTCRDEADCLAAAVAATRTAKTRKEAV